MRLECPSGMIDRKFLGRLAPPFFDRWTRGESLQAVAMIRAATGVGITLPIMWNANMSHLRMYQPMQNPSVYDCATADASSHGEIQEIRNGLRSSPPRLS